MLINHKNFHLTQNPDKTNDAIFLKSPKTMFLDHFWLFLVIFDWWRFFPRNLALSNRTIYAPLMSQSQQKIWKDGRTGRRKDGQTLFYRTVPAEVGGPKMQEWGRVTGWASWAETYQSVTSNNLQLVLPQQQVKASREAASIGKVLILLSIKPRVFWKQTYPQIFNTIMWLGTYVLKKAQ